MKRTDAVGDDGGSEPGFDEPTTDGAAVSAHQSSPDRVVFTEDGNADGWISIDAALATQLRR
ncbi:hypothetical protein [Halobellus rufus]|uniref:hypothetical protein n=1 Tax=Halobellus rufus TaxID=1448860 RepID=UPI00067953AB|nr:hypothetical protein [Halobellus rufus]